MKTIALTLFVAAFALAQSSSSTTTAPAAATAPSKDKAKTASADHTKKAQKAPDQKAVAQKPPAKAEPPVTTIPAGAVQVEPNLYRLTDSNGKTWNYRQTPFGINKWEQTATDAAPAPEPVQQSTSASEFRSSQIKTEPIKVTDLGDSYRFDKNTPFGHSTWIRKKSEVTAKEKAIVEGRDPQSGSDATSDASKPAGN